MSDDLRDQPRILKFIRAMGYQVDAATLSTVAKVADVHALTEDEARAALADLGLIFLAQDPGTAQKCLYGLAILRQGEPGDLA